MSIVLFWALVVSAGMKAVTHCATLTKRVPVQILCQAPPTRQLMCGSKREVETREVE